MVPGFMVPGFMVPGFTGGSSGFTPRIVLRLIERYNLKLEDAS